jgi:hypothetical protein
MLYVSFGHQCRVQSKVAPNEAYTSQLKICNNVLCIEFVKQIANKCFRLTQAN